MEELSVSRSVACPPHKAWDVLANRQEEWFCPSPWRAEIAVQERRPGGRSLIIMHGPDGEVVENEGVFLAWDEGRRFVSTDACNSEFEPAGPFIIGIWEIEPEGDHCRFVARARHWTEEARKQHEEMGFADGWGAMAGQFKDLCERADQPKAGDFFSS